MPVTAYIPTDLLSFTNALQHAARMKKNSILQLEYDDAMKLDMVAAKRAARAAAIHDPNRRNIAVRNKLAKCNKKRPKAHLPPSL
jgi:hypothetical protein